MLYFNYLRQNFVYCEYYIRIIIATQLIEIATQLLEIYTKFTFHLTMFTQKLLANGIQLFRTMSLTIKNKKFSDF